MFFELGTHHCHLDFKRLIANNNVIISRTFHPQQKIISIYNNDTRKIYPDLNPTASQDPQTYHLKNLIKIDPYLLYQTEVVKKGEII